MTRNRHKCTETCPENTDGTYTISKGNSDLPDENPVYDMDTARTHTEADPSAAWAERDV